MFFAIPILVFRMRCDFFQCCNKMHEGKVHESGIIQILFKAIFIILLIYTATTYDKKCKYYVNIRYCCIIIFVHFCFLCFSFVWFSARLRNSGCLLVFLVVWISELVKRIRLTTLELCFLWLETLMLMAVRKCES